MDTLSPFRWILVLWLCFSWPHWASTAPSARNSLVGQSPPAWQVTDWIGSKALTLRELRGKVVLVRWWTAPECPYCEASAPALNEFHELYKKEGLQVIGFYHHKSDAPLRPKEVRLAARKFGFKFPVAIDRDWRTLHAWWLDREAAGWTSVSFLIDRQGVVRHIHPGGQYVKGDTAYTALEEKIKQLLEEPK